MKIMDFKFEMKRKAFHLTSLIVPLIYLFIPKFVAVLLLLIASIITIYVDISRHYIITIKDFVSKFFSSIIRPEEINGSMRLSGASFMVLGFFFSVLLFPKNLVICSWLILIISDCLAALVGIKMGDTLNNGKSLAGSVAFFVSAIFISLLTYVFIGYNTSFITIIASSSVTAAAEFYSKDIGINDNLLIPLVYCFSTIVFSFIL